jgi:adenylate cyclase
MPLRSQAAFKLVRGGLIGLGAALAALLVWSLGVLEPWEAKTWDWRASLLAKTGASTGDIVLILLDQNSLDWASRENALNWPWPRELYGAIAAYCHKAGAKALAFDVLFSEPSSYGVDDDGALGSSLADFGRVAGALFLGVQSGSAAQWPETLAKPAFQIDGLWDWMRPERSAGLVFPRAVMPIPEVARNAAVLCNVHLDPDPDGVYRRVKLFSLFDRHLFPSLGLGAYLASESSAKARIRDNRLTIDGRKVPLDRKGDVLLRFRGPAGTYKAFSAAAVLQAHIRLSAGEEPTSAAPGDLRNKFVFFGFSAPGLYDLRSTPLGGVYPGVEIQATMLDNFLSQDYLRPAAAATTVILVIVLAFVSAVGVTFFSRPVSSLAVGSVGAVLPVGSVLLAYEIGFWLPLVVQLTGVFLAVATGLMINYATEGRQKKFIKNAFKQYLSPAVIEQLIQHPERLKLGGERRILSIFFSDLQGFTTISEGLAPEELTALLNEYLSAMTEIIQSEGGTVDKYEGDAIIAFWNAPLDLPDHAVRVVRAALLCQQRLAEMRPGIKARIGKALFMRIGINTGPAVVGNLGSSTRFDYTMLGDAVNLAARLEGVNKEFGTYTMISQATRDLLGDAFALRELARVAVVGRREAVVVYEPMPTEAYHAKREVFAVFDRGRELFYEGRFDEACQTMTRIREQDPAAAAYAVKCRELRGVPLDTWQGVWVMKSK